jgi:ABC-type uncharacterized transport system YnjBCD ATPase subunit
VGDITSPNPRMVCRGVDVYYGTKQAINGVSLDIGKNEVVSMIGPSGCGKSTFLRCLNRMNDTIAGCRVTGQIALDGVDIYDKKLDVVPLRAQVGMVFQKPNPFPKSIYENVAYGPRIHGLTNDKTELDELVETSLRKAGLWDEVKDRLDQPGIGQAGCRQLQRGKQGGSRKRLGRVARGVGGMAGGFDHRLDLRRQVHRARDRTQVLHPLFNGNHRVQQRSDQMHGIGPPVHAKGHLRGEEGQETIALRDDFRQAIGAQIHRGADIGHLFGAERGILGQRLVDLLHVGGRLFSKRRALGAPSSVFDIIWCSVPC